MFEVHPFQLASVSDAGLASRPINENASHSLGSRAEEMTAVVVRRLFCGSHQPKPSFMNQSGGLQGLAGSFLGHLRCRKLPKFLVNQREQLFACLGVASINGLEN